jgi:hypothetical protein
MTIRLLIAAVGILNVLPGVVAVQPTRALSLYGIDLSEPALALALRHRAVLLAFVGFALLGAAVWPRWWNPVGLLAVVSKGSFLLLYAITGFPPTFRLVAVLDAIGLVVLLVVFALTWPPSLFR